MLPSFENIVTTTDGGMPAPRELGRSREGRSIAGYRFGRGPRKVSLISGCHGDEPVGGRLLNQLVLFLAQCPDDHPMLVQYQWWIIPDANPDAGVRNRSWSSSGESAFDPVTYLRNVVRELPGDDIEFGFPRSGSDSLARPENRALAAWWQSDARPFVLHASLHGMAFAGGPWFLVEPAWAERFEPLQQRCSAETTQLGYRLHDVQRHGEKGFTRLARGFCTRPDSLSMARYFLEKNDEETAARFRPNSMEFMRALGGDPITLVSEMPLFLVPGMGEVIEPSDPVADGWKETLAICQSLVTSGDSTSLAAALAAAGITAMPIEDQMKLQWTMVRAGIELVSA